MAQGSRWHHQTVRDDLFREFPAFAPAFAPGCLEAGGPYLILLGMASVTMPASEAVLIVNRCLEAAEDKRTQVSNLFNSTFGENERLRASGVQRSGARWDQLMSSSNWRPQLVGCVALLAMNPQERPVDALLGAVGRPSWVSPQLLVTAVLADVPGWSGEVESAILKRGDSKAAAALCALQGSSSSQLIDLADQDRDRAGALALGWRAGITAAFDEAGLPRSW